MWLISEATILCGYDSISQEKANMSDTTATSERPW